MKWIQTTKKNGKAHHYFRSPTGFRVPLPSKEDPSFADAYNSAMQRAEREMAERQARFSLYKTAQQQRKVASFYAKMAARMRHRAAALSVPCELSADDLLSISEAQQNNCALTGLPFAFTQSSRGRGSPFAASPDRLDSKKGYVAGNIRMVCQMANYARLDFSDDEFYAMCEAATRYRKRTHRERDPVNQTCKLSDSQETSRPYDVGGDPGRTAKSLQFQRLAS